MGITGELVRSVFSKSHSITTRNANNVNNNNLVGKKRWKKSVRSYLCGDELLFNSVLAEEDTASVKSSEATVTQPVPGGESNSTEKTDDFSSEQATQYESSDRDHSHGLDSKLLLDEDAAAFVIQAAFRGFMARRLQKMRIIISRGLKVQVENHWQHQPKFKQETQLVSSPLKKSPKPKLSLFRQKEDWDDSTVDSSVSKKRNQNRLEAMTRRERALAYAFSQQLRICSKKRPTISGSTELNTSWSWLERWMATRQHEGLTVEDQISKQLSELSTTLKTKPILGEKFLDLSFEEMESCGSNEVPVQLNVSTIKLKTDVKDGYKLSKNRLKSPRNFSRRKTVPTGHYHKEDTPKNKREAAKMKQQLGSVDGHMSEEDVSELSAQYSIAFQNSNSDPRD